MPILIIVFITSWIALLGMIFYRGLEIKQGKMSAERSGGDSILLTREIIKAGKKCYTCIPKEHIRRVYSMLYTRSEKSLNNLAEWIHTLPAKKYVLRFIDTIKGKHAFYAVKESPSPFLRDMLAHKKQIRDNKGGEA